MEWGVGPFTNKSMSSSYNAGKRKAGNNSGAGVTSGPGWLSWETQGRRWGASRCANTWTLNASTSSKMKKVQAPPQRNTWSFTTLFTSKVLHTLCSLMSTLEGDNESSAQEPEKFSLLQRSIAALPSVSREPPNPEDWFHLWKQKDGELRISFMAPLSDSLGCFKMGWEEVWARHHNQEVGLWH